MSEKFLGIEIGGTKIQVFLTDKDINIIKRHKFFVGREKEATIIRDKIRESVNEISDEYKITAAGVGFGGPVDFRTGRTITSHQVSGWADFDLKKWFEGFLNIPVIIDNDANTAALGEASLGAGKNYAQVFYITLGSGVGGGLVINNEIYHAHEAGEVEIGHVRLNKDGTILEDKCSGWAVDRKIHNYIENNPGSIIAQLAGKEKSGEAMYLTKAIKLGDKGAAKILQETADDLAFGVSHAVHLLHPGLIILGGGLSLLGNPLREAVERSLNAYLMAAMTPPDIRIAALKEDAVCLGAALMARKYFELLK